MKIIVERKEVTGVLKTNFGEFKMLSRTPMTVVGHPNVNRFEVLNDEEFGIWINISGDFVSIPNVFPEFVDVKIVLTGKEEQGYPFNDLLDDGSNGQYVEVDDLQVITL